MLGKKQIFQKLSKLKSYIYINYLCVCVYVYIYIYNEQFVYFGG